MKIKETIDKKVAVLSIHGNLMGPPDTIDLYERVRDLTENGVFRIILDLKHVKWINSLGVGAIMHALSIIQKVDGQLHLANLTDKVRSVFVMAQLNKLFEIHESVDDGVEVLNNS
ncbi:MAG: STAS domain-containing protein [Calditrichaceae bacterium]|jgi:anti-sigma B factor antagonist